MSTVLVDSNIFLDVATGDPRWALVSARALSSALMSGELVINPIVYAEVSVGYPTIEDLDRALPPHLYRREAVPFEAGFLAGKAFQQYRRRGGTRDRLLPDFYIGAHAMIAGYRLLTRDNARFRSYFPSIALIEP